MQGIYTAASYLHGLAVPIAQVDVASTVVPKLSGQFAGMCAQAFAQSTSASGGIECSGQSGVHES